LATDRRLAFYRRNLGGYVFDTWTYSQTTALNEGKNLAGRHVQVWATSGESLKVTMINAGDPDALTEAVKARIGGAAA
jgi:hypothetical protein